MTKISAEFAEKMIALSYENKFLLRQVKVHDAHTVIGYEAVVLVEALC